MIKITLLLIATLPVMGGAIISAALPMIAQHFEPRPDAQLLAKLVLTIPALFVALFGLASGWVADSWGRRPVMLFGLMGFFLAGSSGLVVQGPYAMLAGRAGLGISIACLMTVGTALVGDYFTGPERQAFLGKQGAAMALGGMLFVPAGGILVDLHWRAPFATYIVGIPLCFLAAIYLKPAGPNHTSASPSPAGLTVPKDQVALIYGLVFIGMMMFYLIPVQMPFFLTQRIGASGSQIGLTIGFSMIFAATGSMLHKKLFRFLRFSQVQALSYALTALGFVLLQQSHSYLSFLMGLIPVGFGYGLILPNCNLWLIEIIPPQVRGRYLGGLSSMVFLGFFATPFLSWVYPASWGIYSFSSILLIAVAAPLGILGFVGPWRQKNVTPA